MIDVHAHFVPPELPFGKFKNGDWPRVEVTGDKAEVYTGTHHFRSITSASWDLSRRIEDMNSTDRTDYLPTFPTVEAERHHRKVRLAGAYRMLAKFGLDDGAAGHITVRDPGDPECFWVNHLGQNFAFVTPDDLILVNKAGDIIEGDGALNEAAFAIHSQLHTARPDVVAAVHSHSTYGKAWSAYGRPLQPLTQDACTFYGDHEEHSVDVHVDDSSPRLGVDVLGQSRSDS